ncbi:MAG: YbhB/YbcL family Raf kinase inhibitor-like protein [Acidimicrobiaceae bacterium]|nr:YbhB/YbcL family Raf kinase inhibitor-like protein [Acidimicrobiaceae bacterium]
MSIRTPLLLVVHLLSVLLMLAACSSEEALPEPDETSETPTTTSQNASDPETLTGTPDTPPSNSETASAEPSDSVLGVSTSAWQDGDAIPVKYSCDGSDVSPPLDLENVPFDTRSLALIMNDPDAPSGNFVHWVIFNLDPSRRDISEGLGQSGAATASEGLQGLNDFRQLGYSGPCPPQGTAHTYVLTVYALDGILDLPSSATADELLEAMQENILASAELRGAFTRG